MLFETVASDAGEAGDEYERHEHIANGDEQRQRRHKQRHHHRHHEKQSPHDPPYSLSDGASLRHIFNQPINIPRFSINQRMCVIGLNFVNFFKFNARVSRSIYISLSPREGFMWELMMKPPEMVAEEAPRAFLWYFRRGVKW